MPFAANGTISSEALPQGIEISQVQYEAALEGLSEGKEIRIEGGKLVIVFPEPLEPESPEPTVVVLTPALFASLGVVILDGSINKLEIASQLSSAYYEDGWMVVAFAQEQLTTDYLIFVQTDVPAKVEQFKDLGSFELVFSDPATGDPINPGRIDLQLLKVR